MTVLIDKDTVLPISEDLSHYFYNLQTVFHWCYNGGGVSWYYILKSNLAVFIKSLQEKKCFAQTIKFLGANPKEIIMNSATYPMIADKGKFFFTEEF